VWATDVVADEVILLGGRGESGGSGPDEYSQEPRSAPAAPAAPPPSEGIGDDDVPF